MDKNTYLAMLQSGVPTCLVGTPGCGKTAFIKSIGKAFGKPVHVETLSQCDPTDVGGWPHKSEDGIVRRMPLDWQKMICDKPCILFLDEISLAPRTVLATMLRVINERETAAGTIHKDTWIACAINPVEFTGMSLPPQLVNRLAMIPFTSIYPRSAWIEGLIAGFPTPAVNPLPASWEALIPKHRSLIASFAARASSEMFTLPKGHMDSDSPWPSERSWELASRVSAACESQGLDDSTAIAALVGEGPALVYIGWRNAQDLPDPEACLANPKGCPLPNEDEKLYVVLSSIAAAVVSKLEQPRWNAAWTILGRVCQANRVDIATVAARVLAISRPKGWLPPKEAAAMLPLLKKVGF